MEAELAELEGEVSWLKEALQARQSCRHCQPSQVVPPAHIVHATVSVLELTYDKHIYLVALKTCRWSVKSSSKTLGAGRPCCGNSPLLLL